MLFDRTSSPLQRGRGVPRVGRVAQLLCKLPTGGECSGQQGSTSDDNPTASSTATSAATSHTTDTDTSTVRADIGTSTVTSTNTYTHMGVSENKGPSYSTLNSRILILRRTPR